MNTSFLFQVPASLIVLLLFIFMLVFNRLGFYVKQKQIKKRGRKEEGLGSVEGSLLGLLALLLSFTFSMSASKYDSRREVMIEEANNIGTVILRSDLYPDSIRQHLKTDLKEYVDLRIAYYEARTDTLKSNTALRNAGNLSSEIWKQVIQASRNKDNTTATVQMVPAMNAMIDIVTTREANNNAHIPDSILWLLFILIISGSFIIGYSTTGDHVNKVIAYGFAIMMVLTTYLIVDLDRPRQGIINMDGTHQKIAELKGMFK